jgi:hypothetical protein
VPAIAPLGASASAPVTVPQFPGATFRPVGSAPNTPRGIRLVVSAVFASWSPVPQRERCIASRLAEWRIWQIAGTYTDSNALGSERCWYTTDGRFGRFAEHIRIATRQTASGAVYCGAGDCHWLGYVSRPNCGAPLALPLPARTSLPAPAALPLGSSGLTAIGFLFGFGFGL